MEDCSSLRSSDSAGTSEEYEIIDSQLTQDSEPQLNIANNGNMDDLQQELTEVMKEKTSENSSPSGTENKVPPAQKEEKPSNQSVIAEKPTTVTSGDDGSAKPEEKSVKEPDPLSYPRMSASDDCNFQTIENEDSGDYTIFNRVMYLGAASINAPRSESEIQRNMAILNAQAQEQALEVSVSVPSNSEGCVIIYDAATGTEMARFKIDSILFCARGKVDMSEAKCFAFTSSHGETPENAIFQCHVFRCQIPEAVARVLITFAATFRRVPKSKQIKDEKQEGKEHFFDISLEIKEEDSKGNFNVVPRDKEFFKLRTNIEKQLILTVTPAPGSTQMGGIPSTNEELHVERCFGLLIAPGRRVKHADMNLLEMTLGWNEKSCEDSQNSKNGYAHGYSNLSHMFGVNEVQVSMGSNVNDKKSYVISGHWDPADPIFDVLNQETPKDRRVSMTVAIDLVMRGIQEPVRFIIETKVRVYPQNERFWYFSKKPLVHLFSLKLKQGDKQYIVLSVDNLGEVERWRPSTMSLSLNLSSLTSSTLSSLSTGRSPSIASIETPGCDDDSGFFVDDDEPLLSGSGEVSKDCPQGELDLWRQVLPKWQAAPQQIPKGVSGLVKRGIPEALRGEVWQLLCGCSDDKEMMETYKVLITKDCASEQGIRRDINRTFPAHDYFKEAGGVGQDALFKISKAYAVYDEEVGYCQGLSFLAAALLLHMPEEQTFCVLVKIMFDYGLRDLFKDGFEILHMRFYQLGKLMEEQLPEIWLHFQEQGVEVHMFASQWFLTLYTAKFPLFMVFHYLDVFLLTGVDSVFQVALALLQMSKKELVSLDFEGILKYFRVSLPKKYRNEDVARQLFKLATSLKVKKLKKYEKEYLAIKEQEALQEDPVVRLERENRRLLEDNMRLERENDDLAHELVTSKISMRHSLDKLEDKFDNLNKEYKSIHSQLGDAEEEKKRLLLEANQVKELLKREVDKGDIESQRNLAIIADYKKICSQLSERLDKEQAANAQTINMYKVKVSKCEKCSGILSPVTGPPGELALEESPLVTKLHQQVRELELELAQTKLALVESECKNQDLVHQLGTAMTELQAAKNTWFQKTLTSFSSLKERTAAGASIGGTTVPTSGAPGSGLQRQPSKESS
ncbi:rab GTPase-activating protein 1-like isoform X3 [Macrobrachium rosenbergii]|uniref:rab GTPase-activating protein 1-like isoform X3 n=1 Tax=Macrobrachium rosenbergii TaxID=79674 RepID=UPI0034D3AED6